GRHHAQLPEHFVPRRPRHAPVAGAESRARIRGLAAAHGFDAGARRPGGVRTMAAVKRLATCVGAAHCALELAMTTPANWSSLRAFTDARIALGRAGVSQPTAAHLAFQLAHAQARDAVHWPLNVDALTHDIEALGLSVLPLFSAAPDRAHYLQRPDRGRRLDARSHEMAQAQRLADGAAAFDLALVVADGLSALAVQRHVPTLLAALLPLLQNDPAQSWHLAPLALVQQGRVAVGDEVGACLGARC